MPIVNTAQIPRASPRSSTINRSVLPGKIGPVMAIDPRHENWIITKVNDFKVFGWDKLNSFGKYNAVSLKSFATCNSVGSRVNMTKQTKGITLVET